MIDVLVSSIICNNLRRAYPDAKWLFGVWINNTRFRRQSNIDTIIRFEEKHRKAKRIPESSLEIRANKYDLLIDAYSKLEVG
jgi:heptosyltransferase-2